MLLQIVLIAIGLALAGVTLRDVFDTVVVPGGSRTWLHLARRIVYLLLPLWRSARGRDRGLSTTFAPLTLVLSFIAWMLLLALAFGMMAYALRSSFHPGIESVSQAVFVAGSSLVTVGLTGTEPMGLARWVMLAAGFCGLAVMTMAVTYLLEVQSSIARRDAGIFKLGTSAGEPPCGLLVLEKYALWGIEEELPQLLRDGRDWCATVRQSHASHPSLIYFRSVGTGAGWPAALGALLDASLFIEHILDLPALRGLAILLREAGTGMAQELSTLVDLKPKPAVDASDGVIEVMSRLMSVGYKTLDHVDVEGFLRARQRDTMWVQAMAAHLGRPAAPLLPAPD